MYEMPLNSDMLPIVTTIAGSPSRVTSAPLNIQSTVPHDTLAPSRPAVPTPCVASQPMAVEHNATTAANGRQVPQMTWSPTAPKAPPMLSFKTVSV